MTGRPKAMPGTSAGEVFALVRARKASTRSDIGKLTGLSRTAVTLRVDQLLSRGLVVERAEGSSTGGRPPVRLEFHAEGGLVLAAALGASRAQVAVCDLAGRVLSESALTVDLAEGPEAVLGSAVKHLDHLLTATGRPASDVLGVGVSVPSAVDVGTGRSVSPAVQAGWGDIAIADFFALRWPVPVRVDNDVNVLALAEHKMHPGVDDVLVVKASTGIGAGIVAGGVLQRGATNAAGEIGHVKVSDGGGVPCRCGNVDCLEAVAGGGALVRALAEQGKPVADVLAVTELVRAGDPDALRLVRESGRRIGEVLAGAVNLLNPAMIIIGGDLAHAFAPLVAGMRELIYQRATAMATRTLRIESSVLHDQAGVAACAVLILDDVLSPSAVDRFVSG